MVAAGAASIFAVHDDPDTVRFHYRDGGSSRHRKGGGDIGEFFVRDKFVRSQCESEVRGLCFDRSLLYWDCQPAHNLGCG